MRDLHSGIGWVHGVGLLTVCRKAPDPSGAQVHYDFAEDLPAVVGGAQHVDSWLDEEVGAGRLRLYGLGISEGTDRDCEEQERDDCQEDVRGRSWLHVDVLFC